MTLRPVAYLRRSKRQITRKPFAVEERLRWSEGFRCPGCASEKGWRLEDGSWACSGCARKVSVTAGTILDRSRVPLADWFTAIWLMTTQKYGISALGLQRLLGLGSYRTAWTMLRKLRSAMVRPARAAVAQSGNSSW